MLSGSGDISVIAEFDDLVANALLADRSVRKPDCPPCKHEYPADLRNIFREWVCLWFRTVNGVYSMAHGSLYIGDADWSRNGVNIGSS